MNKDTRTKDTVRRIQSSAAMQLADMGMAEIYAARSEEAWAIAIKQLARIQRKAKRACQRMRG